MLDMTGLLLHSDEVPLEAKAALSAAAEAAGAHRTALLLKAASALHRNTLLDCSEARDLVGLPPGSCQ